MIPKPSNPPDSEGPNKPSRPVDSIRQLWAAEVARRLEEVRSGRVKTVPGDQAVARVRASLEARRTGFRHGPEKMPDTRAG